LITLQVFKHKPTLCTHCVKRRLRDVFSQPNHILSNFDPAMHVDAIRVSLAKSFIDDN